MFARSIIAILTMIAATNPVMAAAPVSGRWLTGDGKGIVDIGPCGAQLCGRISKLLADTNGPPTDRNNPDPKMRTRPLIGLNILSAFKDAGTKWEGQIYSPERGKTYRSVMFLNKNGTLTVKGCISFLCETQIWKAVH
jgi:uncharacterized protein (DUF2147 family)